MATRKYFTVVTDIGQSKIAEAVAGGQKLNITTFVVGDGNGSYYTPTSDMTSIKQEVWRGTISEADMIQDVQKILRITTVIPVEVSGFVVREMGLLDETGELIAIGNSPDVPKVTLEDGASTELKLSMRIVIKNSEALSFTIDPHMVMMTKAMLEEHEKDNHAHQALINRKIAEATLQRDIVIPTTGWTAIAEGGAGGVKIEIAQEDVTEQMIPIVSIVQSDMDTAMECGMSTIAETITKSLRLYAEKAPYKEIHASLLLLRASGGSTGGTDSVVGMNIEEFYDNYVATSEDIQATLQEVFQK